MGCVDMLARSPVDNMVRLRQAKVERFGKKFNNERVRSDLFAIACYEAVITFP